MEVVEFQNSVMEQISIKRGSTLICAKQY